MHAGARRIYYHHVGAAVLGNEVIGEHIFHIAGIKQGVVDAVDLGVDFGIGNSLRHILYAYHPAGAAAHEVGNGAGAGV